MAIKLTPARAKHILDGDKTGGGHGPGRKISGKSEFPGTLSDAEILVGVEAIANDPSSYGGGAIPSTAGRYKASGNIKGVKITVIVEIGLDEVITAWPVGVPRNP